MVCKPMLQVTRQIPVEFNRDKMVEMIQQAFGKNSGSRSNFKYAIGSLWRERADDRVQYDTVSQKVLSKALAGDNALQRRSALCLDKAMAMLMAARKLE